MLESVKNRLNRKTIRIRGLRHRRTSKTSKVSASVSGTPVWFEADGVQLQPCISAFITAYFISAQKLGRILRTDQKIDPEACPNFPAVAQLTDAWWQLGDCPEISDGKKNASSFESGNRTGLFFSGGVDSFDSLITHIDRIDDLVLVHGFDVPLDDQIRFEALRTNVQKVADETGKRLIVVRTNLREHRLFRNGYWPRNHGAALAAMGQLLGGELNSLLVSASYPSEALVPWGTHPLLDHLWSTATLKVEHVGDELWRLEKVAKHGCHPLLQKHLCVCWQGNGLPINCGSCEKCVRNQLAFLIYGYPIPATFAKDNFLVKSISAIESMKVFSNVYEAAVKSNRLPLAVRSEVAALLRRSSVARSEAAESVGDWDYETLRARVQDANVRKRFEGGAPNPQEIDAYAAYLPSPEKCKSGTVVVLGMTPELRRLGADHFAQVVSIDVNETAISHYKDWLTSEQRSRERIYTVDWKLVNYIDWSLFPPVTAVLGDGVFGNIPDRSSQLRFLQLLSTTFPEAHLIFRKALAVPLADSDQRLREKLRDEFRRGVINADEFGFCIRMQAFLKTHYDPESAILDNTSLFKDCAQLFEQGFFDQSEMDAINRFRYDGNNCLLTCNDWEGLLNEIGLTYRKTYLTGRKWYEFYPVYGIRV